MNNHDNLKDARAIDLDKDGLLEASAGTGKTWTLTRLAVRLLLEKQLDIEQLLIVTYTEKAAGEMKERLRELLEEAVRQGTFLNEKLDAGAMAHLRRQALNYDGAPIQTIHGFCLAALRRYAFENGFHFTLEQGNDDEIADDCLHTLLESGNFPEELLLLAGFTDNTLRRIINLAEKATEGHSRILPEEEPDFQKELDSINTAIRAIGAKNDLPAIWPKLNVGWKNQIRRIQIFHNAASKATPLKEMLIAEEDWEPIGTLTKGKNPTGEEIACVAAINELMARWQRLGQVFLAQLARQVRTRMREYKERHHLLSFNDMLTRMEEGLARPDGLLCESLRRQFKAALVDEFQDTDPVQWAIFRTVFLESDDHRLFIIGDPKQAIYGFRGADINAYYEAATELEHRTPDTARCYRLPDNWRSTPAAIQAGNAFFQEFFQVPAQTDATLRYTAFHPVNPAPAPRNRLAARDADTAGLYGVALDGSTAAALHNTAARWIAADCRRLLTSGVRLTLDNGEERPVTPADLCVLTRTKRTSILVEKELMQLGLPCTIYKKEGIYGTSEALHLSLILRHLAAPEDGDLLRLALLTRFFDRKAGILPATPEPEEPAGRFLGKLARLARLRNWGELFRTLLQESGIALREYPLPDGPRRITNLEQICQSLETAALAGGFDIHRLAEHLVRLLNDEAETADDETLHRIESEEPRIRIMTIHASKGLEFPFVWVTLPLEKKGGNKEGWHTFTKDRKKIYDLTKSHEQLHNHESSEEDKRLLYVALTRGIFRTTLFYKEEDARYLSLPAPPEPDTADDTPWQPDRTGKTVPLPCPLFTLPEQFLADGYRRRRISLASFSSLAGHIDDSPAFGETLPKEPDEPEAPPPELEGGLLLPRGPRTGNLLHGLLETIDFAAAALGEAAFCKAVTPQVAGALFRSRIKPSPGWSGGEKTDAPGALVREVCRLLYSALTITLYDRDGSSFRLCEIPAEDRKHELEFHFHMEAEKAALLDSEAFWFAKGFITGYIDLVFRRGGRYYILDWKSNWLPAWDEDALKKGMQTHQYHLQAAIYAEALTRWLGIHTPSAGKAALGGVYYLFLRGLPEGGGVHSIFAPEPFPAAREATRA